MNTKAKVTVEDLQTMKAQFLLDTKNVLSLDEIPPALILYWDQTGTGINYIPISFWSMESEGSKRMEKMTRDKLQLYLVAHLWMTFYLHS